MHQHWRWLIGSLLLSALSSSASALENSIGPSGIDARRLHRSPHHLTGKKISLGQVEIGRPGKFGLDKVAAWNPPLALAGLFFRNQLAKANAHVDNHAAMVAAIMVSRDKRLRGVAPDARLFSTAIGSFKKSGQKQECLSSQYLAERNGGDIRAINFSFGESLDRDTREKPILDGNALLTKCIDWSARVHDVLYIVAGNQGKGGIPIPTDQYNGMTTAYTAKRKNQYVKVDFANLSDLPIGAGRRLIQREINAGQRRAISLVAPGNKLKLFDLTGQINQVSGTSFAAPHVTATVALLQEFSEQQLRTSQSNWSLAARRHEVMKAILMNAADKIKDYGNGLRLKMSRTVLRKDQRTWLQSDAYKNSAIPLDIQMGTGQLNAFRAYQQFKAGQWSSDSLVPTIGWDYGSVKAQRYQDYAIQQPLAKNSFASITLVWDRWVELEDHNRNQRYDIGENFRDRGLNNLDLFLVSADEEEKNYCASVSRVDSIEHIFCQIPESGHYKIRVEYRQAFNVKEQAYALAWWATEDTTASTEAVIDSP